MLPNNRTKEWGLTIGRINIRNATRFKFLIPELGDDGKRKEDKIWKGDCGTELYIVKSKYSDYKKRLVLLPKTFRKYNAFPWDVYYSYTYGYRNSVPCWD